jgi:hypothetical protein
MPVGQNFGQKKKMEKKAVEFPFMWKRVDKDAKS